MGTERGGSVSASPKICPKKEEKKLNHILFSVGAYEGSAFEVIFILSLRTVWIDV